METPEYAMNVGHLPKRAAGVEWSRPKPVREVVCTIGRAGDARLPKPFGTQAISL